MALIEKLKVLRSHFFELYLLLFHSKLYISVYFRKQSLKDIFYRLSSWTLTFFLISLVLNSLFGNEKIQLEKMKMVCNEHMYTLKKTMPEAYSAVDSSEKLYKYVNYNKDPELVNLLFLKPIIDDGDDSISVNFAGLTNLLAPESCYKSQDTKQKIFIQLGVSTAYFDYIKPIDKKSFINFLYLFIVFIPIVLGVWAINYKQRRLIRIKELVGILSLLMIVAFNLSSILNSMIIVGLDGFSTKTVVDVSDVGQNNFRILIDVYSTPMIAALGSTIFSIIFFSFTCTNVVAVILNISKKWSFFSLIVSYVLTHVWGWIIIVPLTWLLFYLASYINLYVQIVM